MSLWLGIQQIPSELRQVSIKPETQLPEEEQYKALGGLNETGLPVSEQRYREIQIFYFSDP